MNRKDYLKKRDRIMGQSNKAMISLGDRNTLLRALSVHYRTEWNCALFETTYKEVA